MNEAPPTKRYKGDWSAGDDADDADEDELAVSVAVPGSAEDTEGDMATVMQGVVKWYDDVKDYGFITAHDEEFYVRVNALRFHTGPPAWGRRLMTGEYVQFTPGAPHGASGNRARQALGVTGAWGGLLLVEHGDVRFNSYSRVAL